MGRLRGRVAIDGSPYPALDNLLIEARKIGIVDDTHNNTPGMPVKLLAQELVKCANLVPPNPPDSAELRNGRTDQNRITAYLIRSTDGGRTFSQTKPLTEGAWDTKEPAIWGGVRDAYVVWVDDREGSWNVFFKRLGEVQNGTEFKLSSAANCSSPSISGAEPRIYATWQCVEEGFVYNDIYVSRSSDHGVTWSGANKLTKSEAEAVFPKATASIVPAPNRCFNC